MSPALEFPVPTYSSLESLPRDSPVRKLYPDDAYPNGDYYRSPLGRVRYWIVGPTEGPKVSLIHGISTPCVIFKRLVDVLVVAGFQVLVYDIYGRGYSEAPKQTLTTNDYATQLALLLQYVGWKSTYIVGLSMGGGIAAAFSSLFPHLVNSKVVFLASAGLMAIPINEKGERVLPSLAQPEQTASQAAQTDVFAQIRDLNAELLPGYSQVIQDSRKYGPIAGLDWAFKTLATVQTAGGPFKPLLIHGTLDAIVPYTHMAKIEKLVPQAKTLTLEGAGHFFIVEEDHWLVAANAIAEYLSA